MASMFRCGNCEQKSYEAPVGSVVTRAGPKSACSDACFVELLKRGDISTLGKLEDLTAERKVRAAEDAFIQARAELVGIRERARLEIEAHRRACADAEIQVEAANTCATTPTNEGTGTTGA